MEIRENVISDFFSQIDIHKIAIHRQSRFPAILELMVLETLMDIHRAYDLPITPAFEITVTEYVSSDKILADITTAITTAINSKNPPNTQLIKEKTLWIHDILNTSTLFKKRTQKLMKYLDVCL